MSGPPDYAPILTLQDFVALRNDPSVTMGVVVATSGGFDPIHAGHVTCIVEAARLGDTLVVIVNGDDFLTRKKGRPFQDLATRATVISAIRGVDYVVTFEIEDDPTVAVALRAVRPQIFAKGGDRLKGQSLPASEEAACRELGIEVVDGVGRVKDSSSSGYLRAWGEFWRRDGGTSG